MDGARVRQRLGANRFRLLLAFLLIAVVISVVFALVGGTWSVVALVVAFIVGLLIYRALFGRPAAPSGQATLTLCGPITAPVTPAAAANAPANITVANQTLQIASGTTLGNGGIGAAPLPPQLCVTGTINAGGQLISGRLESTASPTRSLRYTGPLADLRLAPGPQPPHALSLSGLQVQLAPTAAIDGAELLTAAASTRALTSELDGQGRIAHAKITRTGRGETSEFFWLELIYLAFLLGIALLYLYPDTSPGGTLSAKLSTPTQVLLKSATSAKLAQSKPLKLRPIVAAPPAASQSAQQSIPHGDQITIGPSTSQSPILIRPETVSLSPDGQITLPDKTKASFNQRLPVTWRNVQGFSTGSSNQAELLGSALGTFAKKNTAAQLNIGKQATSTPWDNFLLWLQDLRRWLHRTFPGFLGPIPIGIFWLGALGSVVRGLSSAIGTADSSVYPWYYNSEYWHIARPIIGAAFALFTYLFFLSILDPKGTGSVGGQYGTYLLAFIVGYSDGTFAALIERTINVLLGPGNPQGPHAG